MIRSATVLLVGLVLTGAGMAYSIKHEADLAAKHMARDERRIAREKRLIEDLEAEWGRLNRPERLQKLAERYRDYLELDRVDPNQIARIEEIPLRSPRETSPETRPKDGGRALAGQPAPETTGTAGKPDPRKAPAAGPKPVDPKHDDPLARFLR